MGKSARPDRRSSKRGAKVNGHNSKYGPLGVFDSGVGGLSVVSEILKHYPDENILYVADQAHVPYGGRPLDEIRAFASGISRFLVEQRCRAIVMACNISSATALTAVASEYPDLPVIGVIQAAAKYAADSQETPVIGVLATAGTVSTRAYTSTICSENPDAIVHEVPCPKFVPIVEAAATDSTEAISACKEYLAPLVKAHCTHVILGCTHYPFLLRALNQAANEWPDFHPEFVDPANLICDVLSGIHLSHPVPNCQVFTTGSITTMASQLPVFLPGCPAEIQELKWESGKLSLQNHFR